MITLWILHDFFLQNVMLHRRQLYVFLTLESDIGGSGVAVGEASLCDLRFFFFFFNFLFHFLRSCSRSTSVVSPTKWVCVCCCSRSLSANISEQSAHLIVSTLTERCRSSKLDATEPRPETEGPSMEKDWLPVWKLAPLSVELQLSSSPSSSMTRGGMVVPSTLCTERMWRLSRTFKINFKLTIKSTFSK